MGQIGKFIDTACAKHPALMRRVLDRPFVQLRSWIHFDEEGEACGCLIGTVALCTGFKPSPDALMPGSDAIEAAHAALGTTWEDTRDVGGQVYSVSQRLAGVRLERREYLGGDTAESDARAAELIKRRIARALGVTYARPAVLTTA